MGLTPSDSCRPLRKAQPRTSGGLVAVLVGAPWLRAFREIEAMLRSLQARYPGVSLQIVNVDVEKPAHEVAVLPTVLLLANGCELGRLEGLRSLVQYDLALESAQSAHVSRGGRLEHSA